MPTRQVTWPQNPFTAIIMGGPILILYPEYINSVRATSIYSLRPFGRPTEQTNHMLRCACAPVAHGPCPIPTSRFCYLRRENNALAPCFDIRFKKEKNCNKLQRQRTNMQQAWADFQSITVANRPMYPSSQLRILRLAHKPLRCRGRQGMHNIGRHQYTLRVATEKMRWVGASVVTTKAKHGL